MACFFSSDSLSCSSVRVCVCVCMCVCVCVVPWWVRGDYLGRPRGHHTNPATHARMHAIDAPLLISMMGSNW